MQAPNHPIANFMAVAQQALDAAGSALRAHFRSGLHASMKADASPVSDADNEVERILREHFERAFPDHGIFGEEHERTKENAPYQWVIDPIDGTRAFLAGYPLFTTLVALTYESIPILGYIDQPVLRERWCGHLGHPTTMNGEPCQASANPLVTEAVIATTSAPYFTLREAELFQNLAERCACQVQGGDAYAYAMLACGQIGLVVDAGLKPYDLAALSTIIQGAGGIVTDWAGQPLTLHSDGRLLAAANRSLHESALALLLEAQEP